MSKTIRETEAEAVAHVVGQALGLQSLAQSADYIQLYNGDMEVLTASLDHIQKTADILDGISTHAKQAEVIACLCRSHMTSNVELLIRPDS